MKHISILGSTGSIGTQTLEIVRDNPDFKVSSISANSNVKMIEEQIREFSPEVACLVDEKAASDLKARVSDTSTKIVSGMDGLCEVATNHKAQSVVTAVVGVVAFCDDELYY